ncbi:MAG: hypothetical protein Q8P97_02180 [bacterium]|nr:hypothetical protein [bacterium]
MSNRSEKIALALGLVLPFGQPCPLGLPASRAVAKAYGGVRPELQRGERDSFLKKIIISLS